MRIEIALETRFTGVGWFLFFFFAKGKCKRFQVFEFRFRVSLGGMILGESRRKGENFCLFFLIVVEQNKGTKVNL